MRLAISIANNPLYCLHKIEHMLSYALFIIVMILNAKLFYTLRMLQPHPQALAWSTLFSIYTIKFFVYDVLLIGKSYGPDFKLPHICAPDIYPR